MDFRTTSSTRSGAIRIAHEPGRPGRVLFLLAALALSAAFPRAGLAGLMDVSERKEIEMGREVANAYIQEYGLVKDPDLIEIVNALGKRLSQAGDRNGLEYRFYILDDPMVNAFALPGGFIFVTKGLLDFTSDRDELAGVIAHEIVHVAKRHGITTYKKGMRAMFYNMILLALTQNPAALTASSMVNETRMTTYGRRAELEADHVGMEYMIRAGVDPVAFLTFLDRMKALEDKRPVLLENYFEAHPPMDERIDLAESRLRDLGVDFQKNRVVPTRTRVEAWESCRDGRCAGTLKGRDIEIFQLETSGEEATSYDRALSAAKRINEFLTEGLKSYEVRVKQEGPDYSLWIKNHKVLDVLPEDAEAAGTEPQRLASLWREKIQRFLWADSIKGI